MLIFDPLPQKVSVTIFGTSLNFHIIGHKNLLKTQHYILLFILLHYKEMTISDPQKCSYARKNLATKTNKEIQIIVFIMKLVGL